MDKQFENNVWRYDYLASDYDAWYDDNKAIFEAELAAVKQLLPAGRSVEIGAGSGRFAQALGVDLAIEPSTKMAAKIKSLGIEVMSACAEELPLEDASFDNVLFLTVLEFVADIKLSLEEAFRILKPSGSLIIAFLNVSKEAQRSMKTDSESKVYYEDAKFLDLAQIETLLAACDAEIKAIKSVSIEDNHAKIVEGEASPYTVIRAMKK